MVPLFGAIPGGPELLIVFMFGVLGLLVPVGLAYWVYQDATARGNDDATLWALGTVLAGLFVFLVGALAVAGLYVLVGRE